MLETKNADLVVFNDVGRPDIGFDVGRERGRPVSREAGSGWSQDVEGQDCERDPRRGREAPGIRRRGSSMSDAYTLFREGQKRLRTGMAAQATVPLEKAKKLEPEKASIREALGIAYFRLARWEDAEREFRTIVEELSPTDHYAHYALGRALEHLGRTAEANGHYKLASSMDRVRDLCLAHSRPGRPVRPSCSASRARGTPGGSIGPGSASARRRGRRHRDAGGSPRVASCASSRTRREVRPLAPRHGRRRARRQPVHAARGHREGQPAELLRGEARGPSRSTSGSRGTARTRVRSRPGSSRRMRSSSRTTGRSRSS